MDQYERFLSFENFKLAFYRLKSVKQDYYKELYIDDLSNFQSNLQQNIYDLIYKIKTNKYTPSKAFKIYIPKPNGLTLRPITIINFIDELVYQAIINILAEEFYIELKNDHNKLVFGNIYNGEKKSSHNFYIPWKEQWNEYQQKSRTYYSNGFDFVLLFDFASFYDTIDHFLLECILKHKNIDVNIITLLLKQLEIWTVEVNFGKGNLKHGIPQGPLGSGFLGEIVLNYIDEKMKIRLNKDKNDMKYLRYVDDIRIFTKTERDAKLNLAYLDLLAKDIGLLSQTKKIEIKKIDNIDELLNIDVSLDHLAKNYEKKQGLSKEEENRLTKKLIDTLEKEIFHKTTIRYSIYKIGRNEKVKKLLIEKSEKINYLYEDICWYLQRYYFFCPEVKKWIIKQIYEDPDKFLFKWPIAILFKFFHRHIPFSKELLKKHFNDDLDRNWYVNYFILDWVEHHSPSILNTLHTKHPILFKKLYQYKFKSSTDKQSKNRYINEMLSSNNYLIKLATEVIVKNDNLPA